MTVNEYKVINPLKFAVRVIFALIIIGIQLFIYYLIFFANRNLPYIDVFSLILSIILVIHLYNSSDNISYKLTWTICILLFNIAGPIFYICFGGGNNLPKQKYKAVNGYLNAHIETNEVLKEVKEKDLLAYQTMNLLHQNTGFYPYHNQGEEFYPDGDMMFEAMLKAMYEAKRYIFLEYFIIASGEMFDILFEVLKKKAFEGVEIKLLYDYVGCNVPRVLHKEDLKRLSELPNFELATYNPISLRLNLGINYRDHRKILIIDGTEAFVGGINIADEYIHRKERFGFWRDNGMKITGEATFNYLLIFAQNWCLSTKKGLEVEKYKGDVSYDVKDGFVFAFGDGPSNRKHPAYDLYYSLIMNAKEEINISTPYFIIDRAFVKALCDKAKSGVKVNILVPGIPDKKIIYWMAEQNFDDIIAAGGKIFKLSGGFNHAKTLTVDGKYGVLGTFNIDYRSMFLHFECANYMYNMETLKEINDDFYQTISEQGLALEVHQTNPFKKLLGILLSILSPLV